MTDLIINQEFTSAAGLKLPWKIECDALSDQEWEAIAKIMTPHLPEFGTVVGIPTGGIKLANAMKPYLTEGNKSVLITDDVWTTGKSMKNTAKLLNTRHWFGLVVFARASVPANIWWMFRTMEKPSHLLGSKNYSNRKDSLAESPETILERNPDV